MKKLLSLLLAVALLTSVFVFTACQKDEVQQAEETTQQTATETVETEEVTAEEPVMGNGETLTVMISSGDNENSAITTALEKAAEILNVNIEYDVFPADQMLNVVNTKLATGNAGDLLVHVFGLTDVSAKDLAPLSGEWTEKIRSNVYPICVDQESGEVLKAPLGGSSNMGLVYNKTVLEQCGVTLPINNYAEFLEACEKIEAQGITPVYISNKEVWTAQILLLASMTSTIAETPDLLTGIVTNEIKPYENEDLRKLWENVVGLKDLGYINDDYMSATNAMGFEAVANGTAAFYAHLDGSYGEIKAAYPDKIDDLGMMPCPMWDDEEMGYVLFGSASNYLSVVQNSENLELAKEFINVMLSEEVLMTYYELSPGAAPYFDLGFDLPMSPFNKEMNDYAETMKVYGDFTNNIYEDGALMEPFYGRFNEQIQNLFSGLSVEEAMDDWYNAYAEDAAARRVDGFVD